MTSLRLGDLALKKQNKRKDAKALRRTIESLRPGVECLTPHRAPLARRRGQAAGALRSKAIRATMWG